MGTHYGILEVAGTGTHPHAQARPAVSARETQRYTHTQHTERGTACTHKGHTLCTNNNNRQAQHIHTYMYAYTYIHTYTAGRRGDLS